MEMVEKAAECGVVTHSRKVRAFFASKACRSAVMVGDPLAKNAMVQIIRNLSNLAHPWNCPHGRATIRLLASLAEID
jgi:DNA mismatch repair protein PMS2